MMQINRNNYEAYLLDYIEGTLDEMGRDELVLFLKQNPDLHVNLDDVEVTPLIPDSKLVYDDKNLLKKTVIHLSGPIHQENYEEWIVAFLEGDLSHSEQEQFQEFVKLNPSLHNEIAMFKNTFLSPDENVQYHEKGELKKKVPFYLNRTIVWPSAVAAVLVLLFGIFTLLKNDGQVYNNQKMLISEKGTNFSDAHTDLDADTYIPEPLPSLESPAQIKLAVSSIMEKPLRVDAKVEVSVPASKETIASGERQQPSGHNFQKLAFIPFNGQFGLESASGPVISLRNEMTTAFHYLALRDALLADREQYQNEKSTFGKVIANLGNKLFGSPTDASGSLLGELTSRSKESFSGIAEAVPVYSKTDESGRKNTYFALSENLKFRVSKDKNKQENSNAKGHE